LKPSPKSTDDVSADLDRVRRITITDCGSTTTKAILIEKQNGVFRQVARGDAPTTVEAPRLDITQGVAAAVANIGAMCGIDLLDPRQQLIRPASDTAGQDLYLSTSSAGGGLQMVVAGLVKSISAKAALNAALGAGAIVTDVLAFDEDSPMHAQIHRLRSARPDMVLVTGGTDHGATLPVLEIAELLAKANPRPRFGEAFELPVIFAGNAALKEKIHAVLGERFALFTEENVLKGPDQENPLPARERIHALFLNHVMRQAPGFSALTEWTDAPVMPTPSAVAEMLQRVSLTRGDNLLLVDIGGATTDIFSTVNGALTRTVSANLGMSYSATEVLIQAGIDPIRRWLTDSIEERVLVDLIMNKTIRPTTIPDSKMELDVEQALAREAMRLAFRQHMVFAGSGAAPVTDLMGNQQQRDTVTPMTIDTIIGSGGVLSHAPDPKQAAAMLVDAFCPEGVTRLAKDEIFMMPHLGVLSRLLPEIADAVFESDCLTPLGTCVAPVASGKPGHRLARYQFQRVGQSPKEGTLSLGELKGLPLPAGEQAEMTVTPAWRVDVGAGPGKMWRGVVTGGPAGVILDGRGRPEMHIENQRQNVWAFLLEDDSNA
jgi:uncharacterized protein (TIGR01319 family)